MDVKEKIGQLIISRPRAKDIESSVRDGIVGGIYVPPDFNVEQVNEFKHARNIPLIVAADLECGELSGCGSWPCALAAAQSGKEAVYEWAKAQALEARSVGVDAVFGPVFDIVFTRNGIATGYRPFGETPEAVAELGYEAVRGYQEGGLLTFCKHFPGFGRADDDAHISLSSIGVSKDVFMREDMLPYLRSAYQDPYISGVMTGHISIPCIDGIPSPMSEKIIGLLRQNGFAGLIITDSLAMKSIQFYYTEEQLYVGALKAGHDMIVADYNTSDREGFEWIYKAYKDGVLTEKEIDEKVARILAAKKRLAEISPEKPDFKRDSALFKTISQNSIKAGAPIDASKKTLFVIADEKSVAVSGEVAFSSKGADALVALAKDRFSDCDFFLTDVCPSADTIADILLAGLRAEQVVFIVHAPVKAYAGTSHFHKPMLSLIDGMKRRTAAVAVWGNPFAADDLPEGVNTFLCYDFGDFAPSLFEKLT
ncbi:MAG: hypothetical protein J5940_01950 [Clostridia bacterium]|nr:hypothetical protein [Clostridia bacterium]